MPTSFTSVANGDPMEPGQLNQFIAPIQALETTVESLATPSLDQLSDVAVSSPTTGQTIRYNGSSFVNAALSASDVGAAASSHVHAASDITSGTVATARLGSGTANNSTYLRGDGSWQTPPGGSLNEITNGTLPTDTPIKFPTVAQTGWTTNDTVVSSNTSTLILNVPTGWTIQNRLAGQAVLSIGANGLVFGINQSVSGSSASIVRIGSGNNLVLNNGGGSHVRNER